ncbi:hypothetical protein TNCV_63871 [Trichonephila clavipes]|nr:hypothetical protein TNCV_63871 [Trichonephila clavipes]
MEKCGGGSPSKSLLCVGENCPAEKWPLEPCEWSNYGSYALALHTITPVVRAVCLCTGKAGLRRSLLGLHKGTRLSSLPKLNLDFTLKTT